MLLPLAAGALPLTSGGAGPDALLGVPLTTLIPLALTWLPVGAAALALTRSSVRDKLNQLRGDLISTLESEVKVLTRQNEGLTARVETLETATAEIPILRARIAAKDAEIATLRARLAEVEQIMTDVRAEREALRHERNALRSALNTVTEERDALLRRLAGTPQPAQRSTVAPFAPTNAT